MARSKDVYAVIGLMCIDRDFRNQFFENYLATSKKLVGSLSHDEKEQLKRVAGEAGVSDKVEHVRVVKERFEGVQMALGCPSHPCPEPDPWDA